MNGVVKLYADSGKVVELLRWAGYCNKFGKPLPPFQLYSMRCGDIIRVYEGILGEILGYYSFVNNYRSFVRYIRYILMGSCARLLAAKLKLGSVSKVYKKFGKILKVPGKNRAGFNCFLGSYNNRSRFKFKVSDCVISLLSKRGEKS